MYKVHLILLLLVIFVYTSTQSSLEFSDSHGSESEESGSEPRVAIIGGGPAGITTALVLKSLGITRTVIFELQDRVGGSVQPLQGGNEISGFYFSDAALRYLERLADPMETIDWKKEFPRVGPFPHDGDAVSQSMAKLVKEMHNSLEMKFLFKHLALDENPGKLMSGLTQQERGEQKVVIPEELLMPACDWLKSLEKDDESTYSRWIRRVAWKYYFELGLGTCAEDLPAWNLIRHLFSLSKGPAYHITTGSLSIWQALVNVSGIDVRLNTPILEMKRKDTKVLVRPIQLIPQSSNTNQSFQNMDTSSQQYRAYIYYCTEKDKENGFCHTPEYTWLERLSEDTPVDDWPLEFDQIVMAGELSDILSPSNKMEDTILQLEKHLTRVMMHFRASEMPHPENHDVIVAHSSSNGIKNQQPTLVMLAKPLDKGESVNESQDDQENYEKDEPQSSDSQDLYSPPSQQYSNVDPPSRSIYRDQNREEQVVQPPSGDYESPTMDSLPPISPPSKEFEPHEIDAESRNSGLENPPSQQYLSLLKLSKERISASHVKFPLKDSIYRAQIKSKSNAHRRKHRTHSQRTLVLQKDKQAQVGKPIEISPSLLASDQEPIQKQGLKNESIANSKLYLASFTVPSDIANMDLMQKRLEDAIKSMGAEWMGIEKIYYWKKGSHYFSSEAIRSGKFYI